MNLRADDRQSNPRTAGKPAGGGHRLSSVGERREAVAAVVRVGIGCLLFAGVCAGCSTPSDPEAVYSNCADVFRAGQRTIAYPENPVSCLNKAGDVSVVVSKQYHCDDGTTLFANDYGWWSTEDNIPRVPTDRGKPPRAALDRCVSR